MRFVSIILFSLLSLTYKANANSVEKYQESNEPPYAVEVTTLTQGFANIYWVKIGEKAILIDSGNPGKGEKIVERFQKMGLEINDVEYLILTHAHPDHAGNALYFQEKYGIKIIAGHGDMEIIKAQGVDVDLCPRGALGFIIGETIAKRTYDTFVPDIILEDGLNLSDIGLAGFIHLLPGHTHGSLYVEIDQSVFVGDLIRGQTLNAKKPAYHIFMCDLEDNFEDIQKLFSKTHINTWYPGHGGALSKKQLKKFIDKNNKQKV